MSEVSSREAVRLAVQELGADRPNAEYITWVKQNHGHDVTKYISQYKNGAKKSLGITGGGRSKKSSATASAAAPAAPAAAEAPAKKRGRPKGSVNKRTKTSAASVAAAVAAPAAPAAKAPRASKVSEGGIVHDIKLLKELIKRHSAAGIKELVDFVG